MTKLQATIVSIATVVIGQVIAIVPSWAPEQKTLISIAGTVAGLIVVAIHLGEKLIANRPSVAEFKADAEGFVKDEVTKINWDGLAEDVKTKGLAGLAGQVKSEVQAEFAKLRAELLAGGLAASPPPLPDPPAAPPAVAAVPQP